MYKNGISVVISSYNALKTLEKCLDAFQVQDFPFEKYEVILVDDGSTDTSQEYITTYITNSLFHLRYIYQEHRGVGIARNTGIENSQFEIIAFTDADCIPDSNWQSTIYESLTQGGQHFIGGYTYTDDTVIFPWKNAPVHQMGITANMAITRDKMGAISFGTEFLGMLGDDTNFVMQLAQKGVLQTFIADMRVFHPVNILTFERLIIRTRGRQNEVLLYKKYGKGILSSFHPLFQPRILGRLSLFSLLFFSILIFTILIITLYGFNTFFLLFLCSYILFHFYLYTFFIVYKTSEDIQISHIDRLKTFLYSLFVLPLFVYYRLQGSIKFKFLML